MRPSASTPIIESRPMAGCWLRNFERIILKRKREFLLCGLIAVGSSLAFADGSNGDGTRAVSYDVLKISTLLEGTALKDAVNESKANDLLILPAPPSGGTANGSTIDFDTHLGFFEPDTAFKVGHSVEFDWPPGTKKIVILVTRKPDEHPSRQETVRKATISLKRGSTLYGLTSSQVQRLIDDFQTQLLLDAKSKGLCGVFDWREARRRFTASFESDQVAFWEKCFAPDYGGDVQCDATSLNDALGDASLQWHPAIKKDWMHLMWITEGMSLEINWGSDTVPLRLPKAGSPGGAAMYSRPTQAGTSTLSLGTIKQGLSPFEPMCGILIDSTKLDTNSNPLGPISGDELNNVLTSPAGQVMSIFNLSDFYQFGDYFVKMPSSTSASPTAAALILAMPATYEKEDNNARFPIASPNFSDVQDVKQRFILFAFNDGAAAGRYFSEGWKPKSEIALGDPIPYAAGIIGNHTFVQIFANIRVNGSAEKVSLGTPLSSMIESLVGECAFGQSLTLIRTGPFLPDTATGPLGKGRSKRVKFHDLPPSDQLAKVVVAPLDSIQLGPPPE